MGRFKKDTGAPVTEVPDGGYGWVIVFGAALTHFLLVGIGRCLGIVHMALLSEFGQSETETAWVAAIFNTCRTLTAPLCAMLADWLGNRTVALLGSILMFIGLSLSAFATKLFHLYITFGVCAGIGGAMVFTTAYIMVGKYFAKNKGKAMGFALLGCGLGNIAFAHITNLTMHTYGYWGTMLILGAIQLNHAISGALYRPLEIQSTNMDEEAGATAASSSTKALSEKEMLAQSTEKVYVNKHLAKADPQYTHQIQSLSAIPDHIKLSGSFSALPQSHRLNTTEGGSQKNSMHQLHTGRSKQRLGSSFNSLVYAMSNTNVADLGSQTSVNSGRQSHIKLSLSKRASVDSNALIKKSLEDGDSVSEDSEEDGVWRTWFKCHIDSNSLLFNVQFYLYAVVIMAMQVGIQGFLIFLPGFAREFYLNNNDIATLISIYGISDMVGSLGFGFIIDLQCVQNKRIFLFSCAGILFGVFMIFMAGMKSFVCFCVITCLVGTFEGATHSQRMSILSDFVPPDKIAVAVGMVLLFQGIGNIYGPPVGGLLRDVSQTNAYCFVFCGIYMSVTAFVFLVYSIVTQVCQRRSCKQTE